MEDDENGGISIAPATATESDEYITFDVTVPATYERSTVDWATSDGTATAGEDYTAASGTLVFEVGDTSKTIQVAITDDGDFEANETFNVTPHQSRGGIAEHGPAPPGPSTTTMGARP